MSNIPWCDITSNPVHLVREDGSHGGHWCRKISAGCKNCYAEAQNQSNYFSFASHLPYIGSAPANLILDETVLQSWLKLKKPRKIFVCSMTDLFGNWVSDQWLDKVFAYMAHANWHTYQILTKRPERMRTYLTQKIDWRRHLEITAQLCDLIKPDESLNINWPLNNVWIGVSVENQQAADTRIDLLIQTPAKIRFLSCEPLLEEIDLSEYLEIEYSVADMEQPTPDGGGSENAYPIDWVIVGGESGNNARPCNINWVRSLVQQCKSAGVKVFVKQLGSNAIDGVAESHYKLKLKDRKGGAIEEFPNDLKIREFPI